MASLSFAFWCTCHPFSVCQTVSHSNHVQLHWRCCSFANPTMLFFLRTALPAVTVTETLPLCESLLLMGTAWHAPRAMPRTLACEYGLISATFLWCFDYLSGRLLSNRTDQDKSTRANQLQFGFEAGPKGLKFKLNLSQSSSDFCFVTNR